MNWWKRLKGKVKLNEPLKEHTTFKIGGPAKFFIEPKDIRNLKLLIISASKYNLPIFILGSGSNILVKDSLLNAVVVRLNSAHFKKISYNNNYLEAGSGLKLNQLISSAAERGLSGLEFLTGIPGTLGGALAMNAGCWGSSISDLLENVTVMDYNGKIKTLDRKNLRFNYRKSNLAKYIILGARIKLNKKNKREIHANLNKYLQARRLSQENILPNAGCIFKNPKPGESAAKLIELCGLKGKKIGNACVSRKHANFILNPNKAKAEDVLKLIALIRKEVKDRFGVSLEPEIKKWR